MTEEQAIEVVRMTAERNPDKLHDKIQQLKFEVSVLTGALEIQTRNIALLHESCRGIGSSGLKVPARVRRMAFAAIAATQ